jgi:WG containing repeat
VLYPISVPIPQSEQNIFGYVDGRGQVVVDPIYAGAGCFSEGKASVLDQQGKAGYLDQAGFLVIPHRFMGLGRFVQGLCATGGGYIDHQGNWLISPLFLVGSAFSEGRAFASQDGVHFGYIGFNGDFITEPSFERCCPFSEGLAAVFKNERWGYIDHQGRFALPAAFEGSTATAFRAGRAGACIDGRYGLINTQGIFIARPEYEAVGILVEGRARVQLGGKWGLIDGDGYRIVGCQYDDVGTFDGGIAPARIGNKAGFIGPDGSWIIQPHFDKSFRFLGDLAVVRLGHTWSYISRAGDIVWTSAEGAPVVYPPAPLFY